MQTQKLNLTKLFQFVLALTLVATSIFVAGEAIAAYQRTADNTVPAYTNPELTQRNGNERVDRGDVVTVFEERGNAYYVRYPTSRGTKDRWVPKSIFNDNNGSGSGDVRQKLMYAVFKNSGARITCDFDGYQNTNGRHEGIDMVLSHNAPVYATISGTVTRAGGSFNTVAIYDQSNNKTVVYLHFNSVAVRQGQWVNKGDLVGYQGSNGASASHVHIEVRDGKRTAAAKSVNDPTLDNSNPYDYWNKVL